MPSKDIIITQEMVAENKTELCDLQSRLIYKVSKYVWIVQLKET